MAIYFNFICDKLILKLKCLMNVLTLFKIKNQLKVMQIRYKYKIYFKDDQRIVKEKKFN